MAGRGGRRYTRTIILGVLALGSLVWMAVDQFGVPAREMGELALGTVLAVLVVIGGAALFAALWISLRRLLRRG